MCRRGGGRWKRPMTNTFMRRQPLLLVLAAFVLALLGAGQADAAPSYKHIINAFTREALALQGGNVVLVPADKTRFAQQWEIFDVRSDETYMLRNRGGLDACLARGAGAPWLLESAVVTGCAGTQRHQQALAVVHRGRHRGAGVPRVHPEREQPVLPGTVHVLCDQPVSAPGRRAVLTVLSGPSPSRGRRGTGGSSRPARPPTRGRSPRRRRTGPRRLRRSSRCAAACGCW